MSEPSVPVSKLQAILRCRQIVWREMLTALIVEAESEVREPLAECIGSPWCLKHDILPTSHGPRCPRGSAHGPRYPGPFDVEVEADAWVMEASDSEGANLEGSLAALLIRAMEAARRERDAALRMMAEEWRFGAAPHDCDVVFLEGYAFGVEACAEALDALLTPEEPSDG